MDSRMYPEGSGATKALYIGGVEVIFGVTKSLRVRVPAASLTTTGVALLPALKGVRWRLFDAAMISIGGAATTSTSINISGTSAGVAAELLAVAVAALTQSALVRAGATNAVILANGASFIQQDANAALMGKAIGATLTVATHIDFLFDYVADPA